MAISVIACFILVSFTCFFAFLLFDVNDLKERNAALEAKVGRLEQQVSDVERLADGADKFAHSTFDIFANGRWE